MNIEQLLKLHITAMGGASAIENVSSLEIELNIEEPGFSATGVYRATRDGRVRVDIFYDGERVFTEAYDGTSGWQLAQGESSPTDMSPDGETAVVNGIHNNLFGLHELDMLGYSLTLIGREMVSGTRYWLVHSVSSAGSLKRYLINADTFLIERTQEVSALHPDVDARKLRYETVQSDYREVSGRQFSFITEKSDQDTGDVVQSTKVLRLAVNPEFDDAIFERPD